MRVYHFIRDDHGLENVLKQRLKVSCLDTLNDPYELLSYATRSPEERRIFKEMKSRIGKQLGILCFSKVWSNPVQWSHYADRHSGICLGFDIPSENAQEVEYVTKRLRYDPAIFKARDAASLEAYQRLLTTKFSHWRYEREVRVFVRLSDAVKEGDLYFQPFDEELKLKEIIVGDRCTISRSELEHAISIYSDSSEIALNKARLAFRTFKVVRQRSRTRW